MPTTTRKLRVVHTTRYTYDRPVERSAHELHLRPMGDGDQRVLSHTLTLDPAVPTAELDDAFGNRITRFEITSPYTALTISADSTVELLDADPLAFTKAEIRPAFPLVWTPREQAMIVPYLRPPG
ncbi:transglutaminase N-terminal domain-containing protein [Sorangium sp. So ce315]|uniref:transglutaminase N-terminal domain-containing protein n=1 Tax=Sorangium sp. So ce315 TaxID=3133299 RepID=UPI003F6175F9